MPQQNPNSFPIDPHTTSGTELATRLNELNEANNTTQSGTNRPTYALQGFQWVDISDTVNLLKYFTGTMDLSILEFDTVENKAILNGGNSFTDKARVIKNKASKIPSEIPKPDDMEDGEIFINQADKTIIILDDAGNPSPIGGAGGDYVERTGDTMTGALQVPADATGAEVPQAQEVVRSVTNVGTGETRVTNMVSLTQAQYDAITPDDSTLYLIID